MKIPLKKNKDGSISIQTKDWMKMTFEEKEKASKQIMEELNKKK